MLGKRIDGLFLVAICLVGFMAFNIWQDRDTLKTAQAAAPLLATIWLWARLF